MTGNNKRNQQQQQQYSPVGSPISDSSYCCKEHDRFLPVANVSRIMKRALPANAKISKDAKETVQECVSEFISFITGEASDKCQREKRKTINGDDLLWAMTTLGFENYVPPLKLFLANYRETEDEKTTTNTTTTTTDQVQQPAANSSTTSTDIHRNKDHNNKEDNNVPSFVHGGHRFNYYSSVGSHQLNINNNNNNNNARPHNVTTRGGEAADPNLRYRVQW